MTHSRIRVANGAKVIPLQEQALGKDRKYLAVKVEVAHARERDVWAEVGRLDRRFFGDARDTGAMKSAFAQMGDLRAHLDQGLSFPRLAPENHRSP